MRAISQDVGGGPEVLHLVDLPTPVPGPTEVLVRVHAAGVNPTDAKTRARGRFPSGHKPPFVLGFDVSGTVEAVGDGATLYQRGTAVFGMPRFPHPAGAYAEFVTAPSRHFARTPAELDQVHAAALPLAGLTAWQALVDTAQLQPGQRVLIHAAAGGVGHLAVQIAKARGAHVIATATADKHPLLKDLGADETLDYTTVDLGQAIGPVDVVLDPIGGATTRQSVELLKDGGTLVRLPAWVDDDRTARRRAAQLGVRAVRLLVEPDLGGLTALVALVQAGELRAEIDSIFALEDVAQAHRRIDTGQTTGKIVLQI